MTDPTDARSKAEASHRLAELAKTPRARDLFRQLAEEYEGRARAESSEQGEAAPSIVPLALSEPMSDTDRWLADLKAAREQTA
jgi:hypothetical protein